MLYTFVIITIWHWLFIYRQFTIRLWGRHGFFVVVGNGNPSSTVWIPSITFSSFKFLLSIANESSPWIDFNDSPKQNCNRTNNIRTLKRSIFCVRLETGRLKNQTIWLLGMGTRAIHDLWIFWVMSRIFIWVPSIEIREIFLYYQNQTTILIEL